VRGKSYAPPWSARMGCRAALVGWPISTVERRLRKRNRAEEEGGHDEGEEESLRAGCGGRGGFRVRVLRRRRA
jgi:hypothetical protein